MFESLLQWWMMELLGEETLRSILFDIANATTGLQFLCNIFWFDGGEFLFFHY